jgi:hypothetical protein
MMAVHSTVAAAAAVDSAFVWDQHCRFRESVVALLVALPALPHCRWAQFAAEVELLLQSPPAFAKFVEESPSPMLRPVLQEVQRCYMSWQQCALASKDADTLLRTPDPHALRRSSQFVEGQRVQDPEIQQQQQRPLREEGLAISYAHAVRARFGGRPEVYTSFLELMRQYEDARMRDERWPRQHLKSGVRSGPTGGGGGNGSSSPTANGGFPGSGALLNAALKLETCERLGELFGDQHCDLVEAFRSCIP